MSINNPLNPLKKTGGTSPGEIYSTEETRIGTWLDGKPLYRKTAITNSGSGGWHTVLADFIPGYSLLVSLFGTVEANMNEGRYFPLPYSSSISFGISSGGSLQVRCGDSSWYGKNIIATAIYTKNTDPAPVMLEASERAVYAAEKAKQYATPTTTVITTGSTE